MPPVVAFDIGSTLIHPDMQVLAAIIGRAAAGIDHSHLARAFAYALEADQRALPSGDWATRQGLELLRLLSPEDRHDAIEARDLWLRINSAGGFGSSLYTQLDPDAHHVLSTLRAAGCRLVAASNSDGTLHAELQQFGLVSYFEYLIDSHDIGTRKPDRQFFCHVLSLFNPDVRRATWYIGNDLVRDIVSPLLSGFNRAVLYDRVDAYPNLTTTCRVKTLPELLPLLHLEQE